MSYALRRKSGLTFVVPSKRHRCNNAPHQGSDKGIPDPPGQKMMPMWMDIHDQIAAVASSSEEVDSSSALRLWKTFGAELGLDAMVVQASEAPLFQRAAPGFRGCECFKFPLYDTSDPDKLGRRMMKCSNCSSVSRMKPNHCCFLPDISTS